VHNIAEVTRVGLGHMLVRGSGCAVMHLQLGKDKPKRQTLLDYWAPIHEVASLGDEHGRRGKAPEKIGTFLGHEKAEGLQHILGTREAGVWMNVRLRFGFFHPD
jgi:hypothetical protein